MKMRVNYSPQTWGGFFTRFFYVNHGSANPDMLPVHKKTFSYPPKSIGLIWFVLRCFAPNNNSVLVCVPVFLRRIAGIPNILTRPLKIKCMIQNRRNWLAKIGLIFAGIGLSNLKTMASPIPGFLKKHISNSSNTFTNKDYNMKLGAFSVSLNVKDINASKQFYENLGFKVFAGDLKMNYLIMKNENALIGLFHGMFEKNILTFNPGWDENANKVEGFDDVRAIQKQLKSKGLKLETEADEKTSGPASLVIVDPDGNQILIDQHV